jgi:phenylpyruvate tautomerase
MIVLEGSIPISMISFGGIELPTTYAKLVSISLLKNKKLSGAIASILESKLFMSKLRFFLKFCETKTF